MKKSPNILIAVPHNSGTTYLTTLLANYFKPDIPYIHIADGYDGTDHVLSKYKLETLRTKDVSYIAPMHTRASPYLREMLLEYNLKPIIMTRNIFDCIVSLKDRIRKYQHKSDASSGLVFTHSLSAHKSMTDLELERYLIKFAVPWYFSFYASWKASNLAIECVSYEELIENTAKTIKKIVMALNFDPKENEIEEAITKAKERDTRLNVGVTGRGDKLSIAYRNEIAELMSMYPGIDFSPFLFHGSI